MSQDEQHLRDFFAGLIIQAMVGRSGRAFKLKEDVKTCYEIVDEMMKARINDNLHD